MLSKTHIAVQVALRHAMEHTHRLCADGRQRAPRIAFLDTTIAPLFKLPTPVMERIWGVPTLDLFDDTSTPEAGSSSGVFAH